MERKHPGIRTRYILCKIAKNLSYQWSCHVAPEQTSGGVGKSEYGGKRGRGTETGDTGMEACRIYKYSVCSNK